MKSGILYLVPVPIGHKDDITIRGLNTLKLADFIVCEEFKTARRLLSSYEIIKDLYTLNEHNEIESAHSILKLLKSGKSGALISDSGSPVFSDPGSYLVKLCLENSIKIVPLPGANSIIPALIASGLDLKRFYYYGWLSPNKIERRKELKRLLGVHELIIILDTPYRLKVLVSYIKKIFGNNLTVVLAFDLSLDSEFFYRGNISGLDEHVNRNQLKGEYVLLLENRKKGF